MIRADAIASLRPNAQWMLRGDILDWLDTEQTEPTNAEIDAEILVLEAQQTKDSTNLPILAQIKALEEGQHRTIREATIGTDAEKQAAVLLLKTSEDAIVTLRGQLL